MNLYDAHNQWANRPADERFKTLSELHDAVHKRDRASRDGRVDMHNITPSLKDGQLMLVGQYTQAKLTHWSSTQLLTKLRVPRELLTLLDEGVAENVLRDRLPKAIKEDRLDGRQRILLDTENQVLRAFHGGQYERVWDSEVTRTLMEFLPPGWRNPVAFAGGQWGAALEPSGLYAGDRDMFAIFIDGGDWTDKPVGTFDVDGDGFNRGLIVWNSETGSKSFGYMPFNFRVICGNNIIWGASDVHVVRAAHRGNAHVVLRSLRRYLDVLNQQGTNDKFVEAVRAAKQEIAVAITASKGTTLDAANKKFKGHFTQTQIAGALDAMLREEKSVTGSRWDWLQGFTAVARKVQNADDKVNMEQTAASLLLK